MQEVFADTAFWLALLVPSDSLHQAAVDSSESIFPTARIITSDMIEIEFLNSLSKESAGLKRRGVKLFEDLRSSPTSHVVPFTRELLFDAEKLYSKFSDKRWSIVDCVSFIIMRERGIQNALTHDHHFEQAGFRSLLRK